MNRPILLDLFCGAGGASMGYSRAGFEVTGVDIAPQPRYPFRFIQADALDYAATCGWQYAAIAASPPCQKYVTLQNVNAARGLTNDHLNFIDDVRKLLLSIGKPFVIENVQGSPLYTHIIICGHSLGLTRLSRHRHFETNVMLFAPKCSHRGVDGLIGVYGVRPDGHRVNQKKYKATYTASSIDEAREAMGIDWMEWDEIKEAIPPAYTEWIGRQLIQHVLHRREAVS